MHNLKVVETISKRWQVPQQATEFSKLLVKYANYLEDTLDFRNQPGGISGYDLDIHALQEKCKTRSIDDLRSMAEAVTRIIDSAFQWSGKLYGGIDNVASEKKDCVTSALVPLAQELEPLYQVLFTIVQVC